MNREYYTRCDHPYISECGECEKKMCVMGCDQYPETCEDCGYDVCKLCDDSKYRVDVYEFTTEPMERTLCVFCIEAYTSTLNYMGLLTHHSPPTTPKHIGEKRHHPDLPLNKKHVRKTQPEGVVEEWCKQLEF
jgi:hypothetical protein